MAKEHSFDISAKIDMQDFKNAINLVDREVSNRYDFKGTTYEVTFKEKENLLVLVASSDNKLDALKDMQPKNISSLTNRYIIDFSF